jgi:hypothetical protein
LTIKNLGRKTKTNREPTQLDVYSRYSETNLEYVSAEDERETLQQLGIYSKSSESRYNQSFDKYYD